MNGIPVWWLVISGVYFGLACLFMTLLIVIAIYMVQFLKESTDRMKALSSRVEQISDQVEHLVSQTRTSSQIIGTKAAGIVSDLEIISAGLARNLGLMAALTIGLKAFSLFGRCKSGKCDNTQRTE